MCRIDLLNTRTSSGLFNGWIKIIFNSLRAMRLEKDAYSLESLKVKVDIHAAERILLVNVQFGR
jgi:hypothetical protein